MGCGSFREASRFWFYNKYRKTAVSSKEEHIFCSGSSLHLCGVLPGAVSPSTIYGYLLLRALVRSASAKITIKIMPINTGFMKQPTQMHGYISNRRRILPKTLPVIYRYAPSAMRTPWAKHGFFRFAQAMAGTDLPPYLALLSCFVLPKGRMFLVRSDYPFSNSC